MKIHTKILLMMAILGFNMGCSQNVSTQGYATVAPTEFMNDIKDNKDAYILDVRTPQEFAEGHLDGAHNLDWLNPQAFQAGLSTLPKDETIYIYCRSGARSAKASQYLSQRGYKVVNLAGGFSDLTPLTGK